MGKVDPSLKDVVYSKYIQHAGYIHVSKVYSNFTPKFFLNRTYIYILLYLFFLQKYVLQILSTNSFS